MPPSSATTAVGWAAAGRDAAQPIGNYLAGVIAHRFGVPATLQILGGGCLLAASLATVVLFREAEETASLAEASSKEARLAEAPSEEDHG